MITTHHVPGTPCWLDLGAPDVERAADFYRSVFGWEAESPASEDYVLFRLHGKVVAAIGKLTEQGARSAWMVYFNTPDADATTAAVQRLGGTVRIQPVEPMAGGGKMAQVSDPQGAQFAIFEAGADRGLQLVDDPGGLMWLELYTTDAAAAKEFYGTLFNWEYEDILMPDGGGTYSMIGPAGQGQERMLGGLMELEAADLPGGRPYWHPVFHVENCDTVVNSVTGHGGNVQMGARRRRRGRPAGGLQRPGERRIRGAHTFADVALRGAGRVWTVTAGYSRAVVVCADGVLRCRRGRQTGRRGAMNGQSTAASDYGTSGWSADEVAVLTDAVEHAPSVHNTHPWWLAVHDRTAVLRERTEAELLHHDPNGRDRSISCGTALTNLVLAVRSLGWRAETRIETGEAITATVVGTQRAPASEEDMRRFRAVKQRRSDRAAFTGRPLTGAERDAVAGAAAMPGIQLAWIDGEPSALAVARLLEYAARVYHDDPGYQRELTMWTQAPRGPRDRGLAAHAFGSSGLSAAGLVTGRTRVPDEATLAKRIQHESVCVLGTGNDTAADHVLTGQALQLAWLEATSRGISGSVLTQPLHLVEVRTGLASELELTMVPHVLLRFGRTSAEER